MRPTVGRPPNPVFRGGPKPELYTIRRDFRLAEGSAGFTGRLTGMTGSSTDARAQGVVFGRMRSVKIPLRILANALLIAAAFGSGCNVVAPSACTLIGCT